jgi:hypothetical protein
MSAITSKYILGSTFAAGSVGRVDQNGQMVLATTSLRTTPLNGLSLQSGTAAQATTFVTNGIVPHAIFSLGDGYACAVGVNSSGLAVRAIDSACVSAPNWIGYCDSNGTITVAPVVKTIFDALDFGAVPESTSINARYSNMQAHVAMEVAQDHTPQGSGGQLGGYAEHWPAGNFYFSADPIVISSIASFSHPCAMHKTRANDLIGGGARYANTTTFYIPDGVTGIRFYHTPPTELQSRGIFASGCKVSNIQLRGEGESDGYAHAYDARTAVHFDHCQAFIFGGHGYYIISQDGFPDNWHMQYCRAERCFDGIHVQGGDANNGVCIAGDFQGNRGWGVWDESFLGTTWIGCHTAENMRGAYAAKNDNNSNPIGPSVFLNCYSEGDQLPSRINGFCTVVGGLHGAGFTADSAFGGGASADDLYPVKFVAPVNAAITATGTNPPPMTLFGSIQSDAHQYLDLRVEVVTPGYPFGYDAHHVLHAGQVLTARYSIDGGSTWTALPASPDGVNITHPGTIGRADDNYNNGNCTIAIPGFNVSFNFVPEFYSTDNVYTAVYEGFIRPYFQATSNNPIAAMGFGHKDKTSANADPADWRFIYRTNDHRWRWNLYNVQTYETMQFAGGRALPAPSSVLFSRGLWTTDNSEHFNRLGWVDGAQTFGSTAWRDSTAEFLQWYSSGDVLLNRSQTVTYPLGWRAVQQGGWSYANGFGHNDAWIAFSQYEPGGTIRPTTPNGYIYRARTLGTTGSSEPVWSLTIGAFQADGTQTWENVGTEDGFGSNPSTFEPIGVASTVMLTKVCTAGGTITLSFNEISHERYKLTGSPSADFIVVIGVGAGDSWDRVLLNSTSKNVTVKASGGDTGVVVLAGQALYLLNDGTNIITVGP